VKKLDGYVGFANLPNQIFRKSVKKGFEFTLMVVGKYMGRVALAKGSNKHSLVSKRKHISLCLSLYSN
jgi:septin 7